MSTVLAASRDLFLLALAGAGGTLSRFALAKASDSLLGQKFPLGTWIANIAGCLLFGFIACLADERSLVSPRTRLLLLTGFAGAFTTFSTYAYESTDLARAGKWEWTALHFFAHNACGLGAVLLGAWLARRL